MTDAFPPVAELLPHAGPMRLVAGVLSHDAERTRCRVDPSASALFRDAVGRIPVWVGIEYMAQCAAVHGGLLARARGAAPVAGLFLGSRSLRFHCDAFDPDAPLVVAARPLAGRTRALAFDCKVEGGEYQTLVEGRLLILPVADLTSVSGVVP